MNRESYYIYIITNTYSTVFYTGITSNLVNRIYQHKNKLVDGFTKRYNIWKMVYFEEYSDVLDTLEREKQLKDYRREKKISTYQKTESKASRNQLVIVISNEVRKPMGSLIFFLKNSR